MSRSISRGDTSSKYAARVLSISKGSLFMSKVYVGEGFQRFVATRHGQVKTRNSLCLCGFSGLKIYSFVTSFTRFGRVMRSLFRKELTEPVFLILDSFQPFWNVVRLWIGQWASLIDPCLTGWNLLQFESLAVNNAMHLSLLKHLHNALFLVRQLAFLPAPNAFRLLGGGVQRGRRRFERLFLKLGAEGSRSYTDTDGSALIAGISSQEEVETMEPQFFCRSVLRSAECKSGSRRQGIELRPKIFIWDSSEAPLENFSAFTRSVQGFAFQVRAVDT
jgi:hypothetical protein